MVIRSENTSHVVGRCLRTMLCILSAAIVGSFCGLLRTSMAGELQGVNGSVEKIYKTSGQPSVADEERAIRKQLEGIPALSGLRSTIEVVD